MTITIPELSLVVLIGKPLVVLAIAGMMGFRKRTGFLAGLTLSQISEFSLILMAMGVALNQVGSDILGLVTLVGLLTIAAMLPQSWDKRLIDLNLRRLDEELGSGGD